MQAAAHAAPCCCRCLGRRAWVSTLPCQRPCSPPLPPPRRSVRGINRVQKTLLLDRALPFPSERRLALGPWHAGCLASFSKLMTASGAARHAGLHAHRVEPCAPPPLRSLPRLGRCGALRGAHRAGLGRGAHDHPVQVRGAVHRRCTQALYSASRETLQGCPCGFPAPPLSRIPPRLLNRHPPRPRPAPAQAHPGAAALWGARLQCNPAGPGAELLGALGGHRQRRRRRLHLLGRPLHPLWCAAAGRSDRHYPP